MTEGAFLGLDLGGTGAKAGVFNTTGNLLAFGRAGYTPQTSPDGLTEIPIEEIYEAARRSVAEAVSTAGVPVLAMAVSSQGQTFVSLDSNDKPLHRAIIWYDGRADSEADKLREAVSAGCKCVNLPLIEPISSAPKVMWLRKKMPGIMDRARRCLLLPDYISYRLTGEPVTDPATASTTGLYAEDAPTYCHEALSAAEIDESQVAVIEPSGSPIATVRDDVAKQWGLNRGVLLVTGTNDQYAGALGAGNCRPGIVSETSGTCLALVTLTESLPKQMPPGLIGGRFPITKYQFALAYAKTAGVLLEWFRREFQPKLNLQELDTLAKDVPPGSSGLIFCPHFEGMVSPVPNPSARGFIGNLSLSSTSTDIYRAILESLSYSLRENLDLLKNNGFHLDTVRSIGGGAMSDLWLQIKADVTRMPVEKPSVTEAATLGAAMLAAVGFGEFKSLEECSSRLYKAARVFEPDKERSDKYQGFYKIYLDTCSKVYGSSE